MTGETVSAAAGPLPGPAEAWVPRPYTQLLRGPAHRWWRPLLGLLVVLVGIGAILLGTGALLGVAVAFGVVDLATVRMTADQWWVLLLTNVGLAALIPVSIAAVWLGHGWRPGWLYSVVGRIRWGWMLAVAAVSTAVTVAGSVLVWALAGWPSGSGTDVVVLLLVVALTTPLQAAGEELLFRGWLSQAVGSLIRGALTGAVVSALVSAVLFALAHGAQDVWLFLDRLAFGFLASYLVWRTGGLEAAIAVHAVNNVVVFVPTILTGGLREALLVTEAPPALVAADVLVMVVLAVVITVLARRRRVRRVFVPPAVLVPSRPLR